ncbi:hypothetical protein IFM89_013657, partial [Coptis chinensis]
MLIFRLLELRTTQENSETVQRVVSLIPISPRSEALSSEKDKLLALKADSHGHLPDSRVYNVAPQLIQTALTSNVLHFVVTGISEFANLIEKRMRNVEDNIK